MKLSHNCRIKRYPDGAVSVLIGSRPFGGGAVFREPKRYDDDPPERRFITGEPGLLAAARRLMAAEQTYATLERAAIQDDGIDELAAQASKLSNVERARRRARAAVRDLALSTPFSYFVTLTLDPEKINRYDPATVVKKLNGFLDNAVRRDGLAYILVPELHRDGAIHFHGFFNDALPVVDSGTLTIPGHKRPRRPRSEAERGRLLAAGAQPVYNLPRWGWGFSTAIPLYGERAAAVAYVCKYISKEPPGGGLPEKIGGRWYYSGGALCRPAVEWCDVEFGQWLDMPGAGRFRVPGTDCEFIAFTVEGSEKQPPAQDGTR